MVVIRGSNLWVFGKCTSAAESNPTSFLCIIGSFFFMRYNVPGDKHQGSKIPLEGIHSIPYMPSIVGTISGGMLSWGVAFLAGRRLSMLTTRLQEAGRLWGTGVAGRTVDV